MDKEELHGWVENGSGNERNICQICAVKDGRVVLDDCWHGFQPGDAVNVMSVTKGVMALLTGIAMDKGMIAGTGQKVLDFFPGYAVKRGEKTIREVTVGHLLTMTAPYKFRSEPWTKVCTSPDWTVAALDLLGGRGGITGEFRYSTLGIQILAGIIESASGERCIDFANRHLFSPLGIPAHNVHGDSSKEDQFAFLTGKTPKGNEWYADPRGTVTAGWGLCLSARDLAKIGMLVLDGGRFGGKRVVSEEYVREMTASHVRLGRAFGFMELRVSLVPAAWEEGGVRGHRGRGERGVRESGAERGGRGDGDVQAADFRPGGVHRKAGLGGGGGRVRGDSATKEAKGRKGEKEKRRHGMPPHVGGRGNQWPK